MARKYSWLVPAALMVLLSQLSACRHEHVATARLPDGATASMAVRGMFGLGSDWHRRLEIRAGNGPERPLSVDLLPDSGGWAGSNLYLVAAGRYVLHEGPGGCVAFATDPRPEMGQAGDTAYSCDKAALPEATGDGARDGFAASRFYPGLFYIGQFAETTPRKGVRFIPADQRAEPELPDAT